MLILLFWVGSSSDGVPTEKLSPVAPNKLILLWNFSSRCAAVASFHWLSLVCDWFWSDTSRDPPWQDASPATAWRWQRLTGVHCDSWSLLLSEWVRERERGMGWVSEVGVEMLGGKRYWIIYQLHLKTSDIPIENTCMFFLPPPEGLLPLPPPPPSSHQPAFCSPLLT